MVNKSFIIKLRNIIDKSEYFSSNDFQISEEYNTLKISYNYDEEYFFELRIPNEMSILTRTENQTNLGIITSKKEVDYQEYEFTGRICPGMISNNENFNFTGDSKVKKYILNWLNNLWNELITKPELRKINNLEEEISKINEKFNNIPEDYFTNDEIEKLNKNWNH